MRTRGPRRPARAQEPVDEVGTEPAVPISQPWTGGAAGKWRSIGILLGAQVATMAVWFASAAAAATLARTTPLSRFESALLTSAVQAGSVAGTLVHLLEAHLLRT
jgi:hypothetical protein